MHGAESIVALRTCSAHMRDDCRGNISDGHAGLRRSAAEVGVLEVHEETLVEAAKLLEGSPTDGKARPGDHVCVYRLGRRFGSRVLARGPAPTYKPADQRDCRQPPPDDMEAKGSRGEIEWARQEARRRL